MEMKMKQTKKNKKQKTKTKIKNKTNERTKQKKQLDEKDLFQTHANSATNREKKTSSKHTQTVQQIEKSNKTK